MASEAVEEYEILSDSERLAIVEGQVAEIHDAVTEILGIMRTVHAVIGQASQHPMLGAILGAVPPTPRNGR